MNKKRINELADFFYHSDSCNDVPLRISIVAGMGGRDLTKQELKELLYLLENSENLRTDLENFWNNNYYAAI